MPSSLVYKFRNIQYCREASSFVLLMLSVSATQAGALNPGEVKTIDSTSAVESWTLNTNSELIANDAVTQNITALTAKLSVNGGYNQQIRLERLSIMNMNGGTIENTLGTGDALRLASSSAELTNSTVISNGSGLFLTRNIQDQTGSSVKLSNSTVTAVTFAAQINGLGVLDLSDSQLIATGAASQGVRLLNGTFRATNSSVIGGTTGLLIGSEPTRTGASTVTLDNSHIVGGSGPGISTDYANLTGPTVNIALANRSSLSGGNGNAIEVKQGATVDLVVDNSLVNGNVVVDNSSSANARFQNASMLTGNLENVAQISFDTQSTMNGDVLGADAVQFLNGSTLSGDLRDVDQVVFDTQSAMDGDVLGASSVRFLNASTMNGHLRNVDQVVFDTQSKMSGEILDAGNAQFLNGSTFNGNLRNVSQVVFDNQSTLTGSIESADSVQFQNGSTLIGNVHDVDQVVFNSLSKIVGGVTEVASLSLNNGSSLVGDVKAAQGGSVVLNNASTLNGAIENSSDLQIRNDSQWLTTGNATVHNLTLEKGVVHLGINHQLDVATLSGTGTFVIQTDVDTHDSGFLNVTQSASGDHKLQVTASGTNPANSDDVKIGNIASGDANFALSKLVDAGSRTYELAREGEGLYLRPNQTVSTSTNAAVAVAGSAPSILYGEMTTLNSRMGDRRLGSGGANSFGAARNGDSVKHLSNSVWTRSYGSQYNVSNAYGGGFTQNQRGFALGADTQAQLGGQQWLIGAFVGAGRTDLDLKNGSTATVDSVNAGVYGTLFDVESGLYLDVVGKVNQFDNKTKVTMSDGTRSRGKYKNLGLSATVETGKHIEFDNRMFIEPFVQVGLAAVEGKQYRMDSGLQVDTDAARSLQGKVGVTVGREFSLSGGGKLQPRARMAVGHEFVKSNDVEVNDDDFNSDPSSTNVEYAVGMNWVAAQKKWQVYAELGGSKGQSIDQNWSGNVGVSYNY
jgi:outer membrane autotransporter protein